MIEIEARRATSACGVLCEGPVWDAARERVLWVDIEAGRVHQGRLDADGWIAATGRLEFPGTVGAVAVSAQGILAVAADATVLSVAPDGDRQIFGRVLAPDSGRRINDAGVDPAGRLHLGTLALGPRRPPDREILARVEDDGTLTVIDDDLTLSNGIAWSPSGDRMYNVDSLRRTVYVRDYDPETGRSGAREVFLDRLDGIPDGICVDSEGGLWVALWGAGRACRYNHYGTATAIIDVPAPHVSSIAFLGADLGTLVLTTARHELTAAQIARYPASGALFTADAVVPGAPVTPWRGPHFQKGRP